MRKSKATGIVKWIFPDVFAIPPKNRRAGEILYSVIPAHPVFAGAHVLERSFAIFPTMPSLPLVIHFYFFRRTSRITQSPEIWG